MRAALLHGHTCHECGKLVTCLVPNCEIRATRLEGSFTCGCDSQTMQPTGHANHPDNPLLEAA